MRHDTRLDSLEARWLAMKTPAWPVRLAAQRAFADAVRAKLAQRLTGEPDTPAQVAQYTAARAQWQAVRGESGEDAGARARIAARLEVMARRQSASQETVLRYPRVHTQYAAGSSVGPADRPL